MGSAASPGQGDADARDLLAWVDAAFASDAAAAGLVGSVSLGAATATGALWWRAELARDGARRAHLSTSYEAADAALVFEARAVRALLAGEPVPRGAVSAFGDTALLSAFSARYFRRSSPLELRQRHGTSPESLET